MKNGVFVFCVFASITVTSCYGPIERTFFVLLDNRDSTSSALFSKNNEANGIVVPPGESTTVGFTMEILNYGPVGPDYKHYETNISFVVVQTKTGKRTPEMSYRARNDSTLRIIVTHDMYQ